MALREQYICRSFASQRLASSVLAGTFIDVSFAAADLTSATLSGSFFGVDFSEASLVGARINGMFNGVSLHGADLAFSNLEGSNLDEGELRSAYSLRGAILPNGQPYDGSLRLPGD